MAPAVVGEMVYFHEEMVAVTQAMLDNVLHNLMSAIMNDDSDTVLTCLEHGDASLA